MDVGGQLCGLSLPELQMKWTANVDEYNTCYAVYHLPEHRCFISHGELAIARVEYDGRIAWRNYGADIFSGPVTITGDYVEVTDFNHDIYRFRIADGYCLVGPKRSR